MLKTTRADLVMYHTPVILLEEAVLAVVVIEMELSNSLAVSLKF